MQAPLGFRQLCSGLHQDAMFLAGGDITKLGGDCVEFVSDQNRQELKAFLCYSLSDLSPAERKTLLKREKTETYLRRPSVVTAFLQAALKALD